MDKVTVVITSCGRLDLLDKTLSSFMEFNTYPIEKFIIIDDKRIAFNLNTKQDYDLLSTA